MLEYILIGLAVVGVLAFILSAWLERRAQMKKIHLLKQEVDQFVAGVQTGELQTRGVRQLKYSTEKQKAYLTFASGEEMVWENPRFLLESQGTAILLQGFMLTHEQQATLAQLKDRVKKAKTVRFISGYELYVEKIKEIEKELEIIVDDVAFPCVVIQ